MIFLDTNFLVRFFVNDIKEQAIKAKSIIEKDKVSISGIVLAETVYILKTHYKAEKKDICDKLASLLKQPNIISDKFAAGAIEIYSKESISFYDCLIVSEAIEKGGELKTFDEKLAKVFLRHKKPAFG